MRCNPVNRVQGSGYEKPSNVESVKQIQERIAKMNMDRAKQDQIWQTPKATPALTAMIETMKAEKEST
jgi:hypothetical protein